MVEKHPELCAVVIDTVAFVRTIEKWLMTFLNKLRINDLEYAHDPKFAKCIKQHLEFKSTKTSAFTP